MFLIYPYWNVNLDVDDTEEMVGLVSNLSILECKLDVDDTEEMVGLVSNLSILECKYREAFRRAISVSRF